MKFCALCTVPLETIGSTNPSAKRECGREREIEIQTKNEQFCCCCCCCWSRRIKCRLISFYLQLFFLFEILCERLSIAFSLHFSPQQVPLHRAEKLCPYRCSIHRRALELFVSVYSPSHSHSWFVSLFFSTFLCLFAITLATPYIYVFIVILYAVLNFTGYFIYLIFEMIVFWRFRIQRTGSLYRAKQTRCRMWVRVRCCAMHTLQSTPHNSHLFFAH